MKHYTIHEWLDVCRNVPKRDLDNLMLFTGAEGSGKSTLALQILRNLDPTFGTSRITFTIDDFIANARDLSRGQAIDADEVLINSRKGMWGETIALMDFLQICRGLNLHLALCFPHPDLIDQAIFQHRVRYWVHVVRRGLAYVRERSVAYGNDGKIYVNWRLICRFTFGPAKGALWEDYKTLKSAHMRAMAEPESEEAAHEEWDIGGIKAIKAKIAPKPRTRL